MTLLIKLFLQLREVKKVHIVIGKMLLIMEVLEAYKNTQYSPNLSFTFGN